MNVGQQSFQTAATAGAVAIHAGEVGIWKFPPQRCLQAFGAVAERPQVHATAERAGGIHRLTVAAVVADQSALTQMQGHAGIAMAALTQPAAFVAEQNRGEAASVEK